MVTRIHHKEIERIPQRNRQVRARMQRDVRTIARLAAQLAPKDTGAGAASIHEEEQSDGSWRVSWDTEHGYMLFQELGTETNRPQPFLRPAVKRLER